MTEIELHELALNKANDYLERGFDAEAYLVRYVAKNELSKIQKDLVPESTVDELLQQMLNLFLTFNSTQSPEDLRALLVLIRQTLSEIYNTTTTEEQRQVFSEFLCKCENIV